MPDPYDDPDFRYPNDNRLNNVGDYNNPSQGEVNHAKPPESVGKKGYFPNDNSGHFANSNRPTFTAVDTIKHPPNSNYVPS